MRLGDHRCTIPHTSRAPSSESYAGTSRRSWSRLPALAPSAGRSRPPLEQRRQPAAPAAPGAVPATERVRPEPEHESAAAAVLELPLLQSRLEQVASAITFLQASLWLAAGRHFSHRTGLVRGRARQKPLGALLERVQLVAGQVGQVQPGHRVGRHGLAQAAQAGQARQPARQVEVELDRQVRVVAHVQVAGLGRVLADHRVHERVGQEHLERLGQRVAGLGELGQRRRERLEAVDGGRLGVADHPGADRAEVAERLEHLDQVVALPVDRGERARQLVERRA